MNHQPFRDWLLTKETLSAEQAHLMQSHLAECEKCSQIDAGLKELELVFQADSMVEPMPGFTQRWQARLIDYEHRRQNKQGWVSIGITALLAVTLVTILIAQVWPFLKDPGPFLVVWMNQLIGWISNYFVLQRIFKTNPWLTPGNILLVNFLLAGMISFMSVLWMATYKKITISRRRA